MKIPHIYRNKTFIMCATGPSLTEDVVDTIRQYKKDHIVFGINDSYRMIDFLDEHYACDEKWWEAWGEDFRQKCPNLSSWSQAHNSARWDVKVIDGHHTHGFSTTQERIHFGANSGYQALNIAFLMGGRKFILVGYNMQKVSGKSHFFGDHTMGMSSDSPYNLFVKNFNTIQPEIKNLIVNCTPNSVLKVFRSNDLKDELCA